MQPGKAAPFLFIMTEAEKSLILRRFYKPDISNFARLKYDSTAREKSIMIYCVEDEDSIRELMLYTLSMAGFEAAGFSESTSFWRAMESEQPQPIILVALLALILSVVLASRLSCKIVEPINRIDLENPSLCLGKKEYEEIEPLLRRMNAQNAVDSVQAEAEKRNITLTLSGEEAPCYGIPQVLYSIVYNLCDNAVKYNHENGSVDLTVRNTKGAVTLTVSDSGIGILPEHQDRIFERFYRVDKSHSGEIGGTGLGLSIVKHGVLIHGASIRAESIPGTGKNALSTITVFFVYCTCANSECCVFCLTDTINGDT